MKDRDDVTDITILLRSIDKNTSIVAKACLSDELEKLNNINEDELSTKEVRKIRARQDALKSQLKIYYSDV